MMDNMLNLFENVQRLDMIKTDSFVVLCAIVKHIFWRFYILVWVNIIIISSLIYIASLHMYVFVRKDIDFFQVSMLGQFKQPTLEVIGMKSHS